MWIPLGSALAAPALPLATISGANLQRPCWSPDGSVLSFEANFHEERRIETWIGAPAPDAFRQVTLKARPTTHLSEGFATATATAGRVVHELAFTRAQPGAFVYTATTDAGDYDLFVSAGAPIAVAPGADGNPTWSPDGSRLAFTSARTGEGDLYVLDARAIEGPPRRLTSLADSSELYPDWSPDGASLVFVAHSKTGDNLWWFPKLDGIPARLTSWPGNQIRPRFAPAGGDVAFYANHEDKDRWDLYVTTPGSEPRLLVRGVHPDAHGPSFTSDAAHVVYVADDDAALDPLRAVSVKDPSKVVTLDLGTVGHGDLALDEHGGKRSIAFVAKGRTSDAVRDYDRLFVGELPPLPR